ncbi:pyridoxal-dependent decarboxylase [Patescibacteria group bacterium]|nr:pyridoxal-dependent decarboxylase [Patescibacteria group bacterium]
MPVNSIGLFGWSLFSSLNPHGYGELLKKFPSVSNDFQSFEADIIAHMIDLYGGNQKDFTGMISTGASEGNIYSVWLAKTRFLKQKIHRMALLITSLSHESTRKAAQMMEIPVYVVGLDKNLGMSLSSMEQTIRTCYQSGYRGFILCTTVGYKKTGTADKYEDMLAILEKLKYGQCPTMQHFVWIDAALDGFIAPFVGRKFLPLRHVGVDTLVVDFHKLGLTPYAAGLIVLRRTVTEHIKNWETASLLDSRSTLPSVSGWAAIHSLGKKGFQTMYEKSNRLRSEFLSSLSGRLSMLPTYISQYDVSLFLECNRHQWQQFKQLEERFFLRCHHEDISTERGRKKLYGVKIYFFPWQSSDETKRLLDACSDLDI